MSQNYNFKQARELNPSAGQPRAGGTKPRFSPQEILSAGGSSGTATAPPSYYSQQLYISPRETMLTSATRNDTRYPTPFGPESPRIYPVQVPQTMPDFELQPHVSALEPAPPDVHTKRCSQCRTTTTPAWRRDPTNHLLLCNACGVYLTQRARRRPQRLVELDIAEESSSAGTVADAALPEDSRSCSHCGTRRTSLWRKNRAGEGVCNACGVYERVHGKPRPLELRNDKVRPRGG